MQSYENEAAVCVNCGAPVESGSVFCDKCGWKHGDLLPEVITEEDIRTWHNIPHEPVKEKSRLRVFIPIVLGFTAIVIAALLAVYFLVIKPEILDRTEQVEQEQLQDSDLSEALENAIQEATATPEVTPTVTVTPTATATPAAEPVAPSTITFKFVERTSIDGAVYPRFSMANVLSMTSTSEYKQKSVKNSADLVFDGNEITSWQEGVEGDGIGQSINCQLNRQYQIRYFAFKLGNWRSDKYYNGNGRPKSLIVDLDGYSFTFDFPDEKKDFVIELSEEIPATNITVTINSVYKGAYWDDTCISEFNIYGY